MERYANDAVTTLAASVGVGDTTITVADASKFPNSGYFRVTIDSEIMVVSAVSGTTFTVARGIEGTTAASHASGASVSNNLTAGGLQRLIANASVVTSKTTLPAPGVEGRVITCSEWPTLSWRDSGTQLELLHPVYIPASKQISPTTFTTTAFLGDTTNTNYSYYGGILDADVSHTGSNPTVRGWFIPNPNGLNIKVTACVRYNSLKGEQWGGPGVALRESSSGNMKIMYAEAGVVACNYFNGDGSFNSNHYQGDCEFPGGVVWLQFYLTGGGMYYNISLDGRNYRTVQQGSAVDFFSPDQVGIGCENTISGRTMTMQWLGFWVE